MPIYKPDPETVCTVSGSTGTFKTSLAQRLGADCKWTDTLLSDTRPDEVKFLRTYIGLLLQINGINDNRLNSDGSQQFTDTATRNSVVRACSKGRHSLIKWHFLHVRAHTRSEDDIGREFRFACELLQNNLVNLIIMVVGAGSEEVGAPVRALIAQAVAKVKEVDPSIVGEPTLIYLYPPFEDIPERILKATPKPLAYRYETALPGDGKQKMEAIYRANAAGLHALLPSVTPIQHADFSHNCSNCSETGDHRIMGPCHCGPFALAHGAIRTYRDHLGTISHRHGQLRREPSQLAQVLGPAVAVGGASVPLGSIAIPGQVIGVAASILIYALADVRSRSTSAVKATPAMPTIRAASASARLVAAALPQLDAVSKVYLGWSMSLCRSQTGTETTTETATETHTETGLEPANKTAKSNKGKRTRPDPGSNSAGVAGRIPTATANNAYVGGGAASQMTSSGTVSEQDTGRPAPQKAHQAPQTTAPEESPQSKIDLLERFGKIAPLFKQLLDFSLPREPAAESHLTTLNPSGEASQTSTRGYVQACVDVAADVGDIKVWSDQALQQVEPIVFHIWMLVVRSCQDVIHFRDDKESRRYSQSRRYSDLFEADMMPPEEISRRCLIALREVGSRGGVPASSFTLNLTYMSLHRRYHNEDWAFKVDPRIKSEIEERLSIFSDEPLLSPGARSDPPQPPAGAATAALVQGGDSSQNAGGDSSGFGALPQGGEPSQNAQARSSEQAQGNNGDVWTRYFNLEGDLNSGSLHLLGEGGIGEGDPGEHFADQGTWPTW
ncbi:uncharacterized protein MKK02DRAFT_41445 [Dioszegia hungarica]|uniref:Uncharacterized protein n=1 Tax=Dioszegia hungarica TaxID=4972 RepID=A0AA38LSU4_9TREE|nr:uncharacterized protein MKK02DRAFT_41445 [Dioszegia hungarica]KAI9631816.1 hypothetical protein MKK02DRAFT_41445 [Dioszegia hungarica]